MNSSFSFSQNDSLTKDFINDILKIERYLNKGQTLKIKTFVTDDWGERQYKREFLRNKKRTFIKMQREDYQNDTIKISRKEKREILNYLKTKKGINLDNLNNLKLETTDEKDWMILSQEWEKYAYLEISNPIFLRNNTIALCTEIFICGGNCGYTYFGFYKQINEKWAQWIPIQNGFY